MFSIGDTVIFDAESFNLSFWGSLSHEDRVKYYGKYGYGTKLKPFSYLFEHQPQMGHCTLMDIDTGQLLPMCHISDLRLAREDEA